jgi:hypothetical protein
MGEKWVKKWGPKWGLKWAKMGAKMGEKWGPKWGPKWAKNGRIFFSDGQITFKIKKLKYFLSEKMYA